MFMWLMFSYSGIVWLAFVTSPSEIMRSGLLLSNCGQNLIQMLFLFPRPIIIIWSRFSYQLYQLTYCFLVLQELTSLTLAALELALLAPERWMPVVLTSPTSLSSMTTRWARASSSPAWLTPPPMSLSPPTRRRPSTKRII